MAFLSVGLPGLLLAVVVRLTLREPPRGHADGGARVAAAAQPPIRDVARALWKQKSFRHLALATAVQAIAGYGVIQWVPSFLHRSHHMTSGEIGTALALILGVGGAIGTAAGGYIADRMGKRDMRWQLWIPAIGAMTGAPFAFGIYLAPTALETLAWFAAPILFINAYHGPAFAMTQALAPVSMRAMAAAVLLFVLNIIGLGLGPQLVGIASDLLHPLYGNESLRYALLCVSMVYVWAAAHFWMGARTLRQDLASVTK